MSDTRVMSPVGWDLSLAGLFCAALLAVATSTWLFVRFGRHALRWSVVLTSLAALPGVAMVLEGALRGVQRYVLHISVPQAFALPTTLLSCLWFVVGPILLLAGLVPRTVATDVPRATNLVQAVHVVLWLVSSWVALAFAATV